MASKASLKSTNFWTGVATVAAAAFSYFAIAPDMDSASALVTESQKAVEAISAKNWISLFAVVINAGNILYHLFFKKTVTPVPAGTSRS